LLLLFVSYRHEGVVDDDIKAALRRFVVQGEDSCDFVVDRFHPFLVLLAEVSQDYIFPVSFYYFFDRFQNLRNTIFNRASRISHVVDYHVEEDSIGVQLPSQDFDLAVVYMGYHLQVVAAN